MKPRRKEGIKNEAQIESKGEIDEEKKWKKKKKKWKESKKRN